MDLLPSGLGQDSLQGIEKIQQIKHQPQQKANESATVLFKRKEWDIETLLKNPGNTKTELLVPLPPQYCESGSATWL
jgi:hypothetical protein